MLKYRKGNQTDKLEDLPTLKVRMVRDGDGEGPWVKQGADYVVLQNHAVCFLPFHSWGTVFPSNNPPGENRETIDISHLQPDDGLELHPEAWDSYLENGIIEADGTFIPDENRDTKSEKTVH
jgi:hypothetical protein